ncbi:hypothetical protein CYMTET_37219 [Cymbomonas tetramitiformis]|uniref:Transmembrane protein 53 n=1 Tax=Cymbomonas tetramitiformis TaxID=36881 RepID=A0AAE0CFU1_9CHLO|nr:hypothetical protein CYMTET_37219 [Cymbomonas tetramitiformis]|eukprot:gene2876-3677_t
MSGKKLNILLLGWAGCNLKNLGKYEDVYRSMGHTTLPYTEHCQIGIQEFRVHSTLRKHARIVCDKIMKLHKEDSEISIVCHVFSNGGGMLWAEICRQMSLQNQSSFRFAGLIFDSCPGELVNIKNMWNFFYESQRSEAVRAIFYLLTPLFAFLFFVFYAFTGQFMQRYNFDAAYFDNWLKYPFLKQTPALFLYSKDDILIPSTTVEDMIRRQRLAGVATTVKSWKHSTHVQHLRRHPKEYIEEVTHFLNSLDFYTGFFMNGLFHT